MALLRLPQIRSDGIEYIDQRNLYFNKYVYRMGDKCYEFKTDIVKCPSSGAIEAFKETERGEGFDGDVFSRRKTPISICE